MTESDAPIGPYGLRYGEGDAYWFLDFLTTFKATTGTTGGGFALLEQRAAKEWREAGTGASYSLRLTAEELAGLVKTLDAAIRPYIGLTRADPPEDAQPVHLDLKAFLRPEALT